MARFSFAQIALLAVAPALIAASPLRLRQDDPSVSCPASDGQTVMSGTGSYTITCNYDYYGNDIGVQWTSDFDSCIAVCESTSGCVAVSYNGGACYPKTSTAGAKAATGVWAAKKILTCPDADGSTFTTPNGDVFAIECSTDRYGGDLSISWESTFESCIDTCSTTSGCVDVSYIPGTPGPCYLKNVLNAPQANSAVSGARLVSSSAPVV